MLKNRFFITSWLAMLLSTAGTFLLLLVLTAEFFRLTGSNLKASMVFSAQWVLPLFLAPVIGSLTRLFPIKRTLVFSEVLGAATSIGICILAANMSKWNSTGDQLIPYTILAILVIRGFFESLTKAGRIVALKEYVPSEMLASASSVFNTSFYFGIAIGALAGAALIEHASLLEVAIADAASFLIAAALYMTLPEHPATNPRGPLWVKRPFKSGFDSLKAYGLVAPFFSLLLAVAVFQGWHNIARVALPMDVMRLGKAGVTWLQMTNIFGILAGALFVGRFWSRLEKRPDIQIVFPLAAAVFMALAMWMKTPISAFAVYALFAFAFEVNFTIAQNQIVLRCPKEQLGHVSALNQAVLVGAMTVMVTLMGFVADKIGVRESAVVFALPSALCALIIKRKQIPVPESPPSQVM